MDQGLIANVNWVTMLNVVINTWWWCVGGRAACRYFPRVTAGHAAGQRIGKESQTDDYYRSVASHIVMSRVKGYEVKINDD